MEERPPLSIRQRMLDWLRYRGPSDMQQVTGRAQLVAHFHEIRKRDVRPVLVIQGVPGSGKGRLITHLQAGYRRRVNWWVGLAVDVRLDLTEPALRTGETALASLRQQVRTRRPFWRRLTAIVLTPRFAMMQARLWQHRIRIGAVVAQADQIAEDAASLLRTASAIRSAIAHGGLPLVPLSRHAGLVRWLRLAWEKARLSEASRWVHAEMTRVQRTRVIGGRDEFTTAELQRGLSRAMAEDLAAASRRRWLRLVEAVVFVDGYDLTERPGTVPRSWVADFADDLRAAGAPVTMVLGCRRQALWSERLRQDPERYAAPRELGLFDGSPTIEVHTLDELPDDVCLYELMHQGVPESLAPRLLKVAHGHALALNLLGMVFGTGRHCLTRHADADAEQMLVELRKLSDEHPQAVFDEDWVRRFCSIVAPSLSRGLPESLRWHARAAATLRTFDRDLLAHVMDGDFRGEAFDELVRTPLVVSPRPSTLLKRRGERDGTAYRVRSFLREFWAGEQLEPEWAQRWNDRAAEYFEAAAEATADGHQRFALRAEGLFHRLRSNQAAATETFRATFLSELERGHFDRCETLIGLARDLGSQDRGWRADIEEMAGRSYYGAGNYVLAEGCFRAAKQFAGEEPAQSGLLTRAAQGVASCLRMRGRFDAAQEEIDLVVRTAEDHVDRFQALWTASLVARDRGRLTAAQKLADESATLLAPLLVERDEHAEEARRRGLHHLRRKPAHLLRHQAEIARRAGRYGDCGRLLGEARNAYRVDPEAQGVALLDVVHSHLLRLRGRASEAVGVANAASAALERRDYASSRPRLMALRSVAQAKLSGNRPHEAQELFETMTRVDPGEHPVTVAVAHYGLGELARLRREWSVARDHYRSARDPVASIHVFERVYGHLGLVELEREAGQPERAHERLSALHDEGLAEHPLLSFWIELLGARAYGSMGTGRAATRRAHRLLGRAEVALGRIDVAGDGHPPHRALALTNTALRAEASFEPIKLLLP